MSKKDEAFALFSQGKTINDPEVVGLGLAKKSSQRYYNLWKTLQPEEAEEAPEEISGEATEVEEEAPVTALLGSLPYGAQLKLGSRRYRKLALQAGKIVCLHLTNPELGWVGVTTKAFEPSTVVVPIKI